MYNWTQPAKWLQQWPSKLYLEIYQINWMKPNSMTSWQWISGLNKDHMFIHAYIVNQALYILTVIKK